MSFRDLTDEECAAVLAGLRLLQRAIWNKINRDEFSDVEEILTDGGRLKPPTSDDIDALCERINLSKD